MTRRMTTLLATILTLYACDNQDVPKAAAAVDPAKRETNAPHVQTRPAPTAFDNIIGFSDIEHCVPSKAFEQLLDGLLPTNQLGELIEPYQPSFPPNYSSAFGKSGVTTDEYTNTANVQVSGVWQTLTVSNLEVWKTPESDNEGFAITFDAPFEEVRATLNKLGFRLPVSGKREEGEVLVSYVHIKSEAGQTTLTCSAG